MGVEVARLLEGVVMEVARLLEGGRGVARLLEGGCGGGYVAMLKVGVKVARLLC